MSGACAVALVLLLDASGSVSDADWQTMVDGHADAIQSAGIASIIERGDGVAVSARAFGVQTYRLLPWAMLRTRADAQRFSAAMAAVQRPTSGEMTSVGAAIRDASADLAVGPACAEQVIDLVTDGLETASPLAEEHRPQAEAMGYRINGVLVGENTAAQWMRDRVVSQPGTAARAGFVRHAADWSEFADAIRTKITLEIASR